MCRYCVQYYHKIKQQNNKTTMSIQQIFMFMLHPFNEDFVSGENRLLFLKYLCLYPNDRLFSILSNPVFSRRTIHISQFLMI